jgi:hypothetical protein
MVSLNDCILNPLIFREMTEELVEGFRNWCHLPNCEGLSSYEEIHLNPDHDLEIGDQVYCFLRRNNPMYTDEEKKMLINHLENWYKEWKIEKEKSGEDQDTKSRLDNLERQLEERCRISTDTILNFMNRVELLEQENQTLRDQINLIFVSNGAEPPNK